VVRASTATGFTDGALGTASATSPSGERIEVPLRRVDDRTFEGAVPVDEAGVYAVGASIDGPAGAALTGTALAALTYSAEFAPAPADAATMAEVAARTGGRTDVAAADVWDGDGLASGTSRLTLAPWLMLAAALLFPVAVAMSRLTWGRRPTVATVTGPPPRRRSPARAVSSAPPVAPPPPAPPEVAPPEPQPTTVG
jgi:hypothetical protein